MKIRKFNEGEQQQFRTDEEYANDLGIRGFTITGVEETSDGYRIIGRKNGTLSYFLITSLSENCAISISTQSE